MIQSLSTYETPGGTFLIQTIIVSFFLSSEQISHRFNFSHALFYLLPLLIHLISLPTSMRNIFRWEVLQLLGRSNGALNYRSTQLTFFLHSLRIRHPSRPRLSSPNPTFGLDCASSSPQASWTTLMSPTFPLSATSPLLYGSSSKYSSYTFPSTFLTRGMWYSARSSGIQSFAN